MTDKKQFPTAAMIEARKRMKNRTEEQIKADEEALMKRLLRYYQNKENLRQHLNMLAEDEETQ